MEGKGGSLNKELDFRSWTVEGKGRKVQIKTSNLDHGIVEGKGGSLHKELGFRSWHSGRQGGKFK